MENLNPQKILKTRTRISAVMLDKILPFKEIPTDHILEMNGREEPEENHAYDLFGYFTADIIKENVTFIR